ncbi:TAXI family TRAP transporter solute-binding subunit [Nesterenkonia ebinurensis]|uniref:TAXI family TRAP transporter solute-binding subunit n=1 Tax=Nesterenkonia ebinurensis TaxID=2608252 RepID=UPI00168B4670|nr:TAXI family TRAP transporter solute-binding subunit [Nesterenkonia ebinurensis]
MFNSKRITTFGALAALLITACGSDSDDPDDSEATVPDEFNRMVLVGASQGGELYNWVVAASHVFNTELGMETSVQAGGTQQNALDMESGSITFGTTSVSDLIQISEDEAGPESIEETNIRTLWAGISTPFHVIVAQDSGIESLEDLEGRTIVTGITGSLESEVALTVLECAGVGDSVDVQNIGKDEGAAAFTDRSIDAWTGFGGRPTAAFLQAFESNRGAELLELDDFTRDCVTQEFFDLVESEIPAETYPGQEDAVATLDQWFYAVVPADMPDEVAERLALTLAEHQDQLQSALPSAEYSTAENTAEFPGFQLHPGTVSALEELGVPVE